MSPSYWNTSKTKSLMFTASGTGFTGYLGHDYVYGTAGGGGVRPEISLECR